MSEEQTCTQAHVDKRRGPEISCGCSSCCSGHDEPTGRFDTAVDSIAETIEHVLPSRAATWFCHLEDEGRRDLVCIVAAAILFMVGLILHGMSAHIAVQFVVFALAYLAVGYNILSKAARNIRAGDFFDENLLMSVASLGAFALGEFPEAVAVMLFYRIGEFFEDRAVDKSRDQIMDAVDMRPEVVNVLEDYQAGQAVSANLQRAIPAEKACVGDYILVRPGERIPLDAVVVAGTSRVDTSPVTGEPVPIAAHEGDKVISGCINETAQLVLQVEKPLSESMVTRILDAVEHAAANKPHIERFITRFARVYTPIVIAIAAATAIIPSLITGNWMHWVYVACTFLVISCPCAIVLSIPLTFFAGIGAASKQGILFKGGSSIEALNAVRAVVLDKTGTITRGVFEVQRLLPAAGWNEEDVLALAASAEAGSTHPIAQSISNAAQSRALDVFEIASAEEVAGQGIEAHVVDGYNTKTVLCGNKNLLGHANVSIPHDAAIQPGATHVFVAVDGAYAGLIEIADCVKDDSKAAIQQLSQQTIRTVMLTGDDASAAQAIAQEIGIDEVHAQLLPEQKVDALAQVREACGTSMFVGDGINDAPVLAAADVGAAMGSGSDAAIEAADVVFMNSNLSSVPQSLSLARKVHAIAIQNIVFALAAKTIIMVLGFAGFASMWAAVFADVGVALLCILNAIRILHMYK